MDMAWQTLKRYFLLFLVITQLRMTEIDFDLRQSKILRLNFVK